MQFQKIMFVLLTILPCAVHAVSFLSFAPRSMAMGGTGVATVQSLVERSIEAGELIQELDEYFDLDGFEAALRDPAALGDRPDLKQYFDTVTGDVVKYRLPPVSSN